MKRPVAVSGSGGLIGRSLCPALEARGFEVWRLVRREPAAAGREIFWEPRAGRIDPTRLEGFHGVIHLAGAGIGDGRWTRRRRQEIRGSRVEGTRFLAETLAGLRAPPEVLLSASAIGWYGDRGDEVLTESSQPGQGFLAETCLAWEAAAEPARQAGIRTVQLRTGVVLASDGGALARMLPAYRLGLGGSVGGGLQWVSWISLVDEVRAVLHLLGEEEARGAFNGTAPEPVRQQELARTLGGILKRPAFVPLPGLMVRMALGEMGRSLLLQGQRVHPIRLLEGGFRFVQPDLESALRGALGRQ